MELRPLVPVDEELKHLFTKTLVPDDMVDLTLVGDSYAYLTSLPTPVCDEMATKGLQVRMHPPSQRLVTVYYESKDKSFRLLRNDWAAIVKESGFAAGDKIACWACCHGLGGDFSLLIEKVKTRNSCNQVGFMAPFINFAAITQFFFKFFFELASTY
jgi:hypothetical protein